MTAAAFDPLDLVAPITVHCGSESVTITADEIMEALAPNEGPR